MPRRQYGPALFAELGVPEGQLVLPGASFFYAPEQGVPLGKHLLVALKRADIAAAGLGKQYVQVTAASGGRTEHEVYVLCRKEHSVQDAHQVRCPFGHTVHTDALLHAPSILELFLGPVESLRANRPDAVQSYT
jgi:hypothetical protein